MRISFIIVEYHSIEDIHICISSIIKELSLDCDYEIIISSNSMYGQKFQNKLISNSENVIKWLFNKRNGGFAYAMNQGLKEAKGDILIIMNPDVKIKAGLLDMLSYFQFHEEIGVIAPRIVNTVGMLQDSFRSFITPWIFISRHWRRLFTHSQVKSLNSPQKVDWVIGAFMVISRHSYLAVNGLDENYFLYCEDMDLCRRMYQKGYIVVYYPHAEIEYEGTRSARKSWKYACIFLKSLLRYWRKFGINDKIDI